MKIQYNKTKTNDNRADHDLQFIHSLSTQLHPYYVQLFSYVKNPHDYSIHLFLSQ